MTEISQDTHCSSTEQAPEHSSDFDPNTMRKTKPGLKRLYLTLTVVMSFLSAFPFFWKSIEIYRTSLPFREIDSFSTQIESNPLLFPCHFQAIFVGFDPKTSTDFNPDELKYSLLKEIAKFTSLTPQCGTCGNYTVSVTTESGSHCLQTRDAVPTCLYGCSAMNTVNFDSGDEEVDEQLESVLSVCVESGRKLYTVVAVNRDANERAVVGKYRNAWIVGRSSVSYATARVAEIFINVFINGGEKENSIHGEFMPVGANGKIVLSFDLLNADPHDWVYDWDFRRIDETLLMPIIEALEPVANISIESQVLYHTPKSAFSHSDDKGDSYRFTLKDLPFFVNSNEWHLDTSIAAGGRSKILQFVVYIPSAKECPLLLQLPNGEISKTNGFISPMWGTVVVWNPKNCLKGLDNAKRAKHTISFQDLQNVFEVFMAQFRQLFGLQSGDICAGATGTINLLASERAFTEWELDVLSRRYTCFNLQSCATTLGSLSRLVQSLPRMILMEEIGKQVKFSLNAALLAQSYASLGLYNASAVSSRQARSLAEDAFFHPSIMSVSYYSFEHCFALYSPFFLPVSLHVLLAAVREWRRFKRENAKYMAWKDKLE